MKHEEITHKVIGCAYNVFNTLGFGFLEIIYQKALILELTKMGMQFETEKPMRVHYEGQVLGEFFIDLFVENEIIVELKSVKAIEKEHEVQLVNYLNGMNFDCGLLINFGPTGVEVKRKYRQPIISSQ